MKKFVIKMIVVTLFAVRGVVGAFASGVDSVGSVDIGAPTVGAANINTDTVFPIGEFTSTTAPTGGIPDQTFSGVTFDLNSGTSFSISNGAFSTFNSTLITESTSGLSFENLGILGTCTDGTVTRTDSGPSSFRPIFTPTPHSRGPGSTISDSGKFSIPLSSLPVGPSTSVLLGLGALGLAVFTYRRSQAGFKPQV
jgi:hypothetical protein